MKSTMEDSVNHSGDGARISSIGPLRFSEDGKTVTLEPGDYKLTEPITFGVSFHPAVNLDVDAAQISNVGPPLLFSGDGRTVTFQPGNYEFTQPITLGISPVTRIVGVKFSKI